MEKLDNNSMNIEVLNENLYENISKILNHSRKTIITTVNSTMVMTYFEIGKLIVEDEQNGEFRATYGKEVIKNLSNRLT